MNIQPKFSSEDAERAFNEWGANCGPGAIAAICGLTLDELRPRLGDFEAKHYTNPTLMWFVLKGLGVDFEVCKGPLWFPRFGLARIQWHGPWTEPGVPMRVRYRHTHWVGCMQASDKSWGIFDINCMNNGSGWVSLENWSEIIVPWLLKESEPKANGKWDITHGVLVKSGPRPLGASL